MTWRLQDLPWLPPAPDDFRARCAAFDARADVSGWGIRALAATRLGVNQLTRLSKSIRAARDRGAKLDPLSSFHLGVLGSGTMCLYVPTLAASAARHGIDLSITQANYGQIMQEALSPESNINASGADAVLLAMDYRDLPFPRVGLSQGQSADEVIEVAFERLRLLREGLRRGVNAPLIHQTLPCPPAPILGHLDVRTEASLATLLARYNSQLLDFAADNDDYVLDVAGLAAMVGTESWFNPAQWNMYKLPFGQHLVPLYSEHVARLLSAIRGMVRKCLVLDLDQTLWGGVIGDDGLAGIQISEGDPVGEAYRELQATALALKDRGVILAVSSKNDDAVARQVFRNHPEMLLREEHISVFQANWQDKASNLEAIAKSLNIGVDTLVFVDDNPVERAQVRAALPSVAVPELPDEPALYAWTILNGGYFEAVTFSSEDRQRADQYRANAARAELASSIRDIDDFLASLEMVASFSPFTEESRARVTQLINKTNQFNLTTIRYSEADVTGMMADPNVITLQLRLRDKFGDNGLIAVVVGREQPPGELLIDTWLMSCRVLGRKVENVIVDQLVRLAKERGLKALVGRYVPTAKNEMVKDLYERLGFSPDGRAIEIDGEQYWQCDVNDIDLGVLNFTIETALGMPTKTMQKSAIST